MNVAFIIDGSDSITGRPNGGQWKQVKNWVWDVISALDLESRPAISYVSVMQVIHCINLRYDIVTYDGPHDIVTYYMDHIIRYT